MSTVNVKVKHIRPQYSNLKEWMADENNVYIGRRGVVFIKIDGVNKRFPPRASPWANPFRMKHLTREEVCELYEDHIRKKIQDGLDIEELRGKTLGCWCHPEQCHGDILLKILNERV